MTNAARSPWVDPDEWRYRQLVADSACPEVSGGAFDLAFRSRNRNFGTHWKVVGARTKVEWTGPLDG